MWFDCIRPRCRRRLLNTARDYNTAFSKHFLSEQYHFQFILCKWKSKNQNALELFEKISATFIGRCAFGKLANFRTWNVCSWHIYPTPRTPHANRRRSEFFPVINSTVLHNNTQWQNGIQCVALFFSECCASDGTWVNLQFDLVVA